MPRMWSASPESIMAMFMVKELAPGTWRRQQDFAIHSMEYCHGLGPDLATYIESMMEK